MVLVDYQRCSRPGGDVRNPLAGGGIHTASGGVVKIRHQPRQPRRSLRNSRRQSIAVPSLLRKRNPDGAAGGALNGADGHRIGGGVNNHPIARPGEQAQDSAKALRAPLTTITSSGRVGRPRSL